MLCGKLQAIGLPTAKFPGLLWWGDGYHSQAWGTPMSIAPFCTLSPVEKLHCILTLRRPEIHGKKFHENHVNRSAIVTEMTLSFSNLPRSFLSSELLNTADVLILGEKPTSNWRKLVSWKSGFQVPHRGDWVLWRGCVQGLMRSWGGIAQAWRSLNYVKGYIMLGTQ